MTRLHDVSVGKFDQFKRVLAEADLDGELIETIIHKPALASEWVADLRAKLAPPKPELFRGPREILDDFIVRANQRSWGFNLDQVTELREAMPTDHNSALSSVLTLDIWLGDLSTTITELWLWVSDTQANRSWKWDGLHFDPKHLRLLNPERYGDQPSVKWVELDLTANRGERPCDVRDKQLSAGLGILTAGALHPEWPRNINYETIPGVWLGGLEATVPGRDAWQDVPIFYWYQVSRRVGLGASWYGYRDPVYAVPVFREL